MDLGTIKHRVDSGKYMPPAPVAVDEASLEVKQPESRPFQVHPDFISDIQLVFNNAVAFNPPGHYVYTAAQFLLTFLAEIVGKQNAKLQEESTKQLEHSCSACEQQRCPLCLQGCISLTAPTHHCHGPCKAPITGGRCYQTRDGTRQWCDRCYIRLRGGASPHKNGKGTPKSSPRANIIVDGVSPRCRTSDCGAQAWGLLDHHDGAGHPENALHGSPCVDKDKERAKLYWLPPPQEVVRVQLDMAAIEPWVQCSRCSRSVHQVCVLFNSFESKAHARAGCAFVCPLCQLKAADEFSAVSDNISTPCSTAANDQSDETPDSRVELLSEKPRSGSPEKRADGRSNEELRSDLDADFDSNTTSTKSPAMQKPGTAAPSCTTVTDTPLVPADATSLPRTRLSDFLEERLKEMLHTRSEKDALLMQSLTLRVVSCSDRSVTVNSVVAEHFYDRMAKNRSNETENFTQKYPKVLPYRSKCILLFQNVDGADVALFALYVQEFGKDASPPNKGRVYIAYLDSVKHFVHVANDSGKVSSCNVPRQGGGMIRSAIYHEVLVAYLAHASARGFHFAHIWACPPQRSLSYIFWCHPSDQRTPSREHLREWYARMLQRARACGVCGLTIGLYEYHFSQYPLLEANRGKGKGKGKRSKSNKNKGISIDASVQPNAGSSTNSSPLGGSKPSLERMRMAHLKSSSPHADIPVQTMGTRGVRSREWQDAVKGQDCFEWPQGLPPYFDGDYWPMEAQHQMAADTRVQQQQDQALAHQAAVVAAGQGKPMEVSYGVGGVGSGFHDVAANQTQQYESSLKRTTRRSMDVRQPSWLMKTVTASVQRQKEDHLIVPLLAPGASRKNSQEQSIHMVDLAAEIWESNLEDPDETLGTRRFMDTRQAFHQLCSYSRYQFDTLRHAKHSTMMLLHRLHNIRMPLPFHACSECKLIITARRHWYIFTVMDLT